MPDQHKATIPFTRNHIFDRNRNALKSSKIILSMNSDQSYGPKIIYFADDIFVLLTGKPAIGKRREKRQFLAGTSFFFLCLKYYKCNHLFKVWLLWEQQLLVLAEQSAISYQIRHVKFLYQPTLCCIYWPKIFFGSPI